MTTPCVQLLFPMGGLGTRFAQVGIALPKPLIDVDGAPMILKALSSFQNILNPQQIPVRLLFIVREEHEAEHGLRTKLKVALQPLCDANSDVSVHFFMMQHDTRGAAETCLLARDLLLPDCPVVIMDCDTFFLSKEYDNYLLRFARKDPSVQHVGGLLVYFQSKAPRYSFARLAPNSNEVVQTAEKVPISSNALIGAYCFTSAKLFVDAANRLVAQPINADTGIKEYYISLCFNHVLADNNFKVVAVPKEQYHSFGTPDELANYNAGHQSHYEE